MSARFWIICGAISGFLAVACGAFAAHGLKSRIGPVELSVFETGARYEMYHALALFLVGVLAMQGPAWAGRALNVAGWAFLVGTVLFSGSLYALSISGLRWLGAITPLGGLGFLAGWAALAIAAFNAS